MLLFDERLSVVGMLIGKLSEMFKECYETDKYVTRLFEYLKQYKSCENLKDTVAQAQKDYEKLRRAEQLTKTADRIFRRVIDTLERYLLTLQKEHLEGEEALERVRKKFAEETQKRECVIERTGNSLDYAFDFMEDAFGDSHEMVSFGNGIEHKLL